MILHRGRDALMLVHLTSLQEPKARRAQVSQFFPSSRPAPSRRVCLKHCSRARDLLFNLLLSRCLVQLSQSSMLLLSYLSSSLDPPWFFSGIVRSENLQSLIIISIVRAVLRVGPEYRTFHPVHRMQALCRSGSSGLASHNHSSSHSLGPTSPASMKSSWLQLQL